ncbi:MAG: potassium transporter TrkH [Candidatus Solibacter sp.]|nr:potassium transporter TrkH [Candidatus Solibacter sp.]
MRVAHETVRPFAAASGALLALSAGPFAVAPDDAIAAALLPAICLASAGLIIVRKPKPGRALATMGILGLFALAAHLLLIHPALALAIIVLTMASLAGLWDVLKRPASRAPLLCARARGAALAALLFWIADSVLRPQRTPIVIIPVALGFLIAAIFAIHWAVAARGSHRWRPRFIHGAVVISGLLCMSNLDNPWAAASSGAFQALVTLFILPGTRRAEIERLSWWEPLISHPERMLVGTFLLLSLTGTILLALPLSASGPAGVNLLDAAFTSVSAVCVTGLIVLDTAVAFSGFGQVVILLLIQAGGLGIMTFSTAVLRILGHRMSLRHEGAAASLINVRERGQLADSARRILRLTFAAEAIGAVLLLPRFLAHGDEPAMAIWRAVFTSVSAFCNAGFALQSESLIPYQTDPLVLHAVAALIIAGGLSPVAVYAIARLPRKSSRPASMQVRLGLAGAAALLMGGFVFLLAVEWDGSLGHLAWSDRLHNAWFQSVTLRTAGFNSIDLTLFRPASLSMAMIWMFIGGAPGSTAGGIKTTTAAVLMISAYNIVLGVRRATFFSRQLAEQTRHRAAAVTLMAAMTATTAIFALQLTQAIDGAALLFEVFSALGTVGLSIGATARLDGIGKLIIMACMFIGRVGGLSLLMFMSRRTLTAPVSRPEEEVDVG